MFVRKKKNRSGTTSVVVVDKNNGCTRYVKTIGISSNKSEIDELYYKGKRWISLQTNGPDLFAEHKRQQEENEITEHLLKNIENILLNGIQLILTPVFKLIGFDSINDNILKYLVISRICHPRSKVATVDYLKSYFDEDIGLHKIYRYLDKLHSSQQNTIQKISVEHTQKILGGKIGLVFYDVTTLYFEADFPDDLRKQGYSKDGKHAQPQIVLGLLVSSGGYPLAYSIHEGNKYEGHTMLPVVEDFTKRFELSDFIIVADSGLMNKENITLLEENNYKYIIGARVKNESKLITDWILSIEKINGVFYEYKKTETLRLIVGYSEKRARKDWFNRDKGIKRLEKDYNNGLITKGKVNKRGYNKFLDIDNDIKVSINRDKIKDDEKWDGLKGYLTNTNLPARKVYEEYSGLWEVERAFRITKGTLELRPMFHFTPKRIQAHICICFVAYKVYKELERILKIKGIDLSVDKVLDIAKTITTLKIKLPASNETINKTMILTPKHKKIEKLFDPDFWKTI